MTDKFDKEISDMKDKFKVAEDLHTEELQKRDKKYETDFLGLKKKFKKTMAAKNNEIKKIKADEESEK